MPSSPQPSDDEADKPSGFPGASGLKYTQTIMGKRSGGMGLRVSGKRTSVLKRYTPVIQRHEQVTENFEEDDGNSTPIVPAPSNASIVEESSPKVVQFIPKFKGAAQMEARRKARMEARRRQIGGGPAQPPPPMAPLNPDTSSSDEEEISSVSDFGVMGGNESLGEDDEFDPDFAAIRAPRGNSDSASEALSVLSGSNSAVSTSNSFAPTHSRPPLSPITESSRQFDRGNNSGANIDAMFEMVTPPPRFDSVAGVIRKPDGKLQPKTSPQMSPPVLVSNPSENLFARKKVLPIRSQKSALSAMLATSENSSNPFSETYAAISGRAESVSDTLRIFFPHAQKPLNKAMNLKVRKDATVEEVIGFALWTYWEEGWLPKLDEGLSGDDDPMRPIRLSAIGWIMRIAEEDGEVDDEFPSPDRSGRIGKFSFDAYAVLSATSAQIQQNQLLETKIQRRPSRTTATKKPALLSAPGLSAPSISNTGSTTTLGSSLGSLPLSASLSSSSHGPQLFLRIRVADTADAVHISTTIPVSATMYMQEALELVCKKRKLDPRDYALLLGDMSILIPLDRTVASLQGKWELAIVKRSMLPHLGVDVARGAGRTTDPNASIFKRMSEVPESQLSLALDPTSAYKKYIVYRKMPMLSRQERTLAIDGAYVHITPPPNKAKVVFESPKASSFHIKSLAYCQQSTKSSSIFKLVVSSDGRNKRYDFEAESPKLAAEIIQILRNLKAALERSGTIKSRRSRQVV